MSQTSPKTLRLKRFATGVSLSIVALAAFAAPAAPHAHAASTGAYNARYFANTGHSVGGAFLNFFDRNGGLRVFGLPLTDEVKENGMTVQYFERQRFEYHPESVGTQYEVQLSLLGTLAASGKPATARVTPFGSRKDLLYIQPTGHSVGGVFLDFWNRNGGVRVLGYPVSEPTKENGLIVQYFERARMEYHPEKASQGFTVELSLLGRDLLQGHISAPAAPAPAPAQAPAANAAPASSGGHSLDALEQDLLNRINGARKAAGLQPVAADPAISAMSLHRSQDMVAKNYFSHDAPGGDTYSALLKAGNVPFRWAGEIIAWNSFGADQTAAQAFNGFMQSPPHHDIIMDGRYNYAGVGEARSGDGKYYFTVIFVQK